MELGEDRGRRYGSDEVFGVLRCGVMVVGWKQNLVTLHVGEAREMAVTWSWSLEMRALEMGELENAGELGGRI